jgi:hypothetical protein
MIKDLLTMFCSVKSMQRGINALEYLAIGDDEQFRQICAMLQAKSYLFPFCPTSVFKYSDIDNAWKIALELFNGQASAE